MKNKFKLFSGLLLILFSVGFLMAQTPTSTRVPLHTMMQSKRDNEPPLKVDVLPVAVKLDGNRILGVRGLGENRELDKNEVKARAVTDGESMIIAFESRLKQAEFIVEKDVLFTEATSKALGSNVLGILDGEYKTQNATTKDAASAIRPGHFRIFSILFPPNPDHDRSRSLRGQYPSEYVQLEVISLQNNQNQPKSVFVTIKDGNLLNIKLANGTEKIESKDVYSTKATFVNTQLVLQFDRPLSREAKVELKTNGDIISDKETAVGLGICGCKPGSAIMLNANSQNPTVSFPISGRVRHHRWLFKRTKYIVDDCMDFGRHWRWRSSN